jgi:hypothetical protein
LIVAAKNSVTITDPGGADHVKYPMSFSEGEIRAILRLSPNLHAPNSYPVINQIEMCISSDKDYQGCGTQAAQGRWFAANARVNIRGMEDALTQLDKIPNNPGLTPIIRYEKELQRFYIDVNKAKLRFELGDDLSALEEPIESIDPRIECSDALVKVRKAESRKTATEIVKMEWYNCMNSKIQERVGPYPTDAWLSFLKKASIDEIYVPLEE